MSWTSPRTWAAGEVLTAALLNTHVRDNLKAIGDAWTAYTPTFTNLTLGNGSVIARHVSVGKLIHVRFCITGGTTTSAAGAISWTLPTAAHASGEQILHLKLFDAANFLGFGYIAAGASTVQAYTTTQITSLGNGDIITVSGTYEAA